MAKSNSSRSKSSSKKRNSSGVSNQRRRAVSPAEKSGKRRLVSQEYAQPSIPESGMRQNITAIICIVLAIALFFIVMWPSDAIVTSFLSLSLKRLLGIGAYLLPIMLLILGIVFLTRLRTQRIPSRTLIGLGVFFLGVLILLADFTPDVYSNGTISTDIFSDKSVLMRGGYLGAGPAFIMLMLLGMPVAVILSFGVIVVGLVLAGLSLRSVIERIAYHRERMRQREEEDYAVAPDAPYAFYDDEYLIEKPEPRSGSCKRSSQDNYSAAPTQLLDDEEDFFASETAFIEDDYAVEEPSSRMSRSSRTSHSPRDSRSSLNLIEGQFRGAGAGDNGSETLTRRLGRNTMPANEHEAVSNEMPVDKEPQKKQAKSPKSKKNNESLVLKNPDDSFKLPKMSILGVSKEKARSRAFDEELQETAEHLQQTLEDFGIMATVVDWIAGPTVTLYEIDLPPGVRVSRITALKDDIALALASPGVRIFAPIPKTHYVGIEVPNSTRQNVLLGDILKHVNGGPLEVAIGKDVEGNPIIEDLAKMPHLLIGGTTGSGKSVGINAMIMSILMRSTPSQVRFIMIDPKRVEFAPYEGIPHLYVPVVTEPKEAASALSWGVAEMDLRLKTFQKAGVRNIASFNSLVNSGQLRKMADDGSIDEAKFPQAQYIDTPMPYIVIVIDELSDLMMNVGKEVEFSISRIAQLARAAGIHLIVATQRPSANVVTGLIKANITTRIAFNVASGLDSRVILDTTGAESLIGNGDLLISKPELGRPLRVQGCYTSDDEIAQVVAYLKEQGEPEYHSEILKTNLITLGNSAPDGSGGSSNSDDDPLVWEAADIVVSSGMGSTSNIQRKLKVGYARAGRIMDLLEEKGIVGPQNGSKPREVLISDAMELETLKAFEMADE